MSSRIGALVEKLALDYQSNNETVIVKKRIGVIDFESSISGKNSAEITALVNSLFLEYIGQTTIFTLIERSQLNEIIKEQKLSLSGLVDAITIPEPGQLQGIELFAAGTISESAVSYIVSARLIDVERGNVLTTQSIEIL